MWDRNPIRLALLHMLPEVAARHGVALGPVLERAGLPRTEVLDGGAIVARAQVCAALLQTARRAGEPTIGLALAAAADPVRLGPTGQALFAGRTLREALRAHARQMPSLQGGVAMGLTVRNGRAAWHHRLADSDPQHARVLNEGVAGFLTAAVRAVTGLGPDAVRVSLPHRPQAPLSIYEERLGAAVVFGEGDGVTLTFDAACLDRPSLVGGGLSRSGLPPAALAPPWSDDGALVAAVRCTFESAALGGTLSLADTALTLGLSPRTLQRRLSSLGTSFEALVDRWRHAEARRHLATSALPVAAVARVLGYGHPAHFVRAFHRWESGTPLAFRRAVWAETGPPAAG
jgi:AraC-like DNA-binding protein